MEMYTIETSGKTVRARDREQLVGLASRLAPGTYEISRTIRLGGKTVSWRWGSITITRTGRVALRMARA